MTFSGIHILTPPVDPGRVGLRCTLAAYFAVKFFINGGIKQPVFANVGSSSTSSQIKNSAVADKLRNATATPFRTDSNDHYNCCRRDQPRSLKIIPLVTDILLVVNSNNYGHKYIEPFQR